MGKCGVVGYQYAPTVIRDDVLNNPRMVMDSLHDAVERQQAANNSGGQSGGQANGEVFQTTDAFCPNTHEQFKGSLTAAKLAYSKNKLNRYTGGRKNKSRRTKSRRTKSRHTKSRRTKSHRTK